MVVLSCTLTDMTTEGDRVDRILALLMLTVAVAAINILWVGLLIANGLPWWLR